MILEYSQRIKDQIANFLEQLKKLVKSDCCKIACVVYAKFLTIIWISFPVIINVPRFRYFYIYFSVFVDNFEPFCFFYA